MTSSSTSILYRPHRRVCCVYCGGLWLVDSNQTETTIVVVVKQSLIIFMYVHFFVIFIFSSVKTAYTKAVGVDSCFCNRAEITVRLLCENRTFC